MSGVYPSPMLCVEWSSLVNEGSDCVIRDPSPIAKLEVQRRREPAADGRVVSPNMCSTAQSTHNSWPGARRRAQRLARREIHGLMNQLTTTAHGGVESGDSDTEEPWNSCDLMTDVPTAQSSLHCSTRRRNSMQV